MSDLLRDAESMHPNSEESFVEGDTGEDDDSETDSSQESNAADDEDLEAVFSLNTIFLRHSVRLAVHA